MLNGIQPDNSLPLPTPSAVKNLGAGANMCSANRVEDIKSRAQMENVAEEFESVFVSLLLKEMRGSSQEEGGMFGGESSDSYGGLFDMFMGQHLAKDSPLGIGRMLLQQYEKNAKSG
ncbi:MAG: rod-binding protein [Planctomycetota bacterium]|nr:rod-binding protein [Planctomycetota bacterium]